MSAGGGKFTEMERKAMEAKRQGKQVAVDQQKAGEGPPVVTLREFTEGASGEQPPAAPGPLPPPPEAPAGYVPPVNHQVTSQPQQGQIPEADLEALKNSTFGAPEPEAEEEPAEAEEKEDLFKQTQCPRCGWVLENQSLHEPTDEDKLEFVESVLGSRRFTREVTFLGGRLKVRYRTVLVPEEDAISEHLNELMEKKTIQNEAEWSLAYHRARLVVMLQELELRGETKKYPYLKEYTGDSLKEKLRKALEEVPKAWPLTIHGLLVQGMEVVNGIYQVLMSRAYDPNFWEGQVAESD